MMNKMPAKKKTYLPFFSAGISVFLFLLLDVLFSVFVLPHFHLENTERKYRVDHPLLHHALLENYQGIGVWGPKRYPICTNRYGFKSACQTATNDPGKTYDLAFLGDSFTEGIGSPYETSFVGLIDQHYAALKVANLGVASYAPSFYLIKMQELLKAGFQFHHVIVYIDISDIHDETVFKIENNRVVKTADQRRPALVDRVKAFNKTYLKISSFIVNQTSELIEWGSIKYLGFAGVKPDHLQEGYYKSAWTYNPALRHYGTMGVEGGIKSALSDMTALSDLLAANNIQLSVAVYPWPGQILYDKRASRQVMIWRDFCQNRCTLFIESFSSFFDLADQLGAEKMIDAYYLNGDVHFNNLGNQIVARDFINQYDSYKAGSLDH